MTRIDAVVGSLIVIHLLGLAAVIGPYIVQARARSSIDFRTILAGSVTQLASGLVLVGLSPIVSDLGGAFVASRLVLSIVVVCAVFIAHDRQVRAHRRNAVDPIVPFALLAGGIGALANLAVTVLWPL